MALASLFALIASHGVESNHRADHTAHHCQAPIALDRRECERSISNPCETK